MAAKNLWYSWAASILSRDKDPMLISAPKRRKPRTTCPMHAWAYDADVELAAFKNECIAMAVLGLLMGGHRELLLLVAECLKHACRSTHSYANLEWGDRAIVDRRFWPCLGGDGRIPWNLAVWDLKLGGYISPITGEASRWPHHWREEYIKARYFLKNRARDDVIEKVWRRARGQRPTVTDSLFFWPRISKSRVYLDIARRLNPPSLRVKKIGRAWRKRRQMMRIQKKKSAARVDKVDASCVKSMVSITERYVCIPCKKDAVDHAPDAFYRSTNGWRVNPVEGWHSHQINIVDEKNNDTYPTIIATWDNPVLFPVAHGEGGGSSSSDETPFIHVCANCGEHLPNSRIRRIDDKSCSRREDLDELCDWINDHTK